jgi:predicted nucleotide-binding protein
MVVLTLPNRFPVGLARVGGYGGRRVFMAENQPEGMEKANEIVSKEIIDGFNAILKNILKAWNLIPLLYPDGIGKSLNEVMEICKNIDKKYDKSNLFRVLQFLVKVPFHIEEGLRFNLLGKLESSFKNYKEADHFCDCVLKEFLKAKDTIDKEFVSIFPIFEFIECCCLITKTIKEDSSDVLKYEEGKYIDQVERFRHLAGHFRKFSSDIARLNNKNKELNEELNNMFIIAKRTADMCEEKAEKIEADNKHMAFMKPKGNKVFIVHGHNEPTREKLKEFLEKSYGIKSIILDKESDEGKTIMEKFEFYAKLSYFAFVIMTKDDIVIKERKTYEQGRPNVFFELGWFCGRYGRDRVRIIKEEGAKMPSDLDGIITHNFSENLEEIYSKIKQDLKYIGIEPVVKGE